VAKRFVIDQRKLARAWDARHRATTEDWSDWMRAFALELLRESPSQALRACAALAERNLALSYELLNPAFFSCWEGMSRTAVSGQAAGEQPLPSIEALVASLQMAMESEQMPAQLLQRDVAAPHLMPHPHFHAASTYPIRI
jgi:FKBP12-rapamycin complex-associated protein